MSYDYQTGFHRGRNCFYYDLEFNGRFRAFYAFSAARVRFAAHYVVKHKLFDEMPIDCDLRPFNTAQAFAYLKRKKENRKCKR